ncbi:hypothetical protein DXG01_009593 [Tephrocybe rancida]|nr:hypothetical protein DXG01_009593 [Tephrocybe rancida]
MSLPRTPSPLRYFATHPIPGPVPLILKFTNEAELAPGDRWVIQDARRLAWDALDVEAPAFRAKAGAVDERKRTSFVGVV